MTEGEYIKDRSVQEFLDWIDQTNASRQSNGELIKAYRAREGLWKKYADEAEPIMRFLHANIDIPRSARIQLFTDTNCPDAVLTLENGQRQIETTVTDNPAQVHNRNQLNKYDFGPGDTNDVKTARDLAIRKKAGDPRDFGSVKNLNTMIAEEIERIKDRLLKKLKKEYPLGTILVVDSRSSALDELTEEDVRSRLKDIPAAESSLEIWITIYPRRPFKLIP